MLVMQWDLMTLLEPARTLENLIYLGYVDASTGIHVTRTRREDRENKQTDRNVFHCFVFGPKRAGKSALLNSFLRRPFTHAYNTTAEERYAVNVVGTHTGTKKTLVLREIPEDKARNLLSGKESLAGCDIAIFVHDSSDESSWKRATELLVEVARHCEVNGYEVPSLIIAAKDDLDPSPMAKEDSARVSQDMGIEAPIRTSARLDGLNNLFCRIVDAAEKPHLSIPQTETGRGRKLVELGRLQRWLDWQHIGCMLLRRTHPVESIEGLALQTSNTAAMGAGAVPSSEARPGLHHMCPLVGLLMIGSFTSLSA